MVRQKILPATACTITFEPGLTISEGGTKLGGDFGDRLAFDFDKVRLNVTYMKGENFSAVSEIIGKGQADFNPLLGLVFAPKEDFPVKFGPISWDTEDLIMSETEFSGVSSKQSDVTNTLSSFTWPVVLLYFVSIISLYQFMKYACKKSFLWQVEKEQNMYKRHKMWKTRKNNRVSWFIFEAMVSQINVELPRSFLCCSLSYAFVLATYFTHQMYYGLFNTDLVVTVAPNVIDSMHDLAIADMLPMKVGSEQGEDDLTDKAKHMNSDERAVDARMRKHGISKCYFEPTIPKINEMVTLMRERKGVIMSNGMAYPGISRIYCDLFHKEPHFHVSTEGFNHQNLAMMYRSDISFEVAERLDRWSHRGLDSGIVGVGGLRAMTSLLDQFLPVDGIMHNPTRKCLFELEVKDTENQKVRPIKFANVQYSLLYLLLALLVAGVVLIYELFSARH